MKHLLANKTEPALLGLDYPARKLEPDRVTVRKEQFEVFGRIALERDLLRVLDLDLVILLET